MNREGRSRLRRAAADDDEPIDPYEVPTIMFTLPVDRIFEVARQLANVYCVKTGFAEEIPPDDIKDPALGPFLKATVPPQFALDMQPPDDGDGLNSRSFTAIEGVSLAERIVCWRGGELGFSAEARHASSNANVVREVVVEELKRAAFRSRRKSGRRRKANAAMKVEIVAGPELNAAWWRSVGSIQ